MGRNGPPRTDVGLEDKASSKLQLLMECAVQEQLMTVSTAEIRIGQLDH